MTYLKINNKDYSMYVNKLSVNNSHNYNAQTNAAGNSVVDYINSKRTIDIGIIPLDAATMSSLQADIGQLAATVSFLNPTTGAIETINCIIPENGVEYYTIQANKTLFNAFDIQFIEL